MTRTNQDIPTIQPDREWVHWDNVDHYRRRDSILGSQLDLIKAKLQSLSLKYKIQVQAWCRSCEFAKTSSCEEYSPFTFSHLSEKSWFVSVFVFVFVRVNSIRISNSSILHEQNPQYWPFEDFWRQGRCCAIHTAPEWCQPEKSAILSFSAFLVICDQDKKLHVGQQIL